MPKNKDIIIPIEEALSLWQPEMIQKRIFMLRGQYVMLDSDIALLYGMETKRINEQVKRNPVKFPDRYVFQMTKEEWNSSKSQFATLKDDEDSIWSHDATLKSGRGEHKKYLPYVFTERGASMLATTLKGERASLMSVRIIDAFFAMRDFIRENAQVFQRLSTLEQTVLQTNSILLSTIEGQQVTRQQITELQANQINLAAQVDKVQQVLTSFPSNNVTMRFGVYFDGEVFDAFVLVEQLIKKATIRIVLIDDYVDGEILERMRQRKDGVTVDVYVSKQHQTANMKSAFKAYQTQYSMEHVELHTFNKSHDRWLIIDDEVYHFGASIKDLGKRWFAVEKISEISATELINRIK